MSDCVTKIDVTNIGRQHDLRDALKEYAMDLDENLLMIEEL